MTAFRIRDEEGGDRAAVAALIVSAFAGRPYASGTEARIHAALHEAGAATVALVAEDAGRVVGRIVGQVVGQVIVSPVTLDGRPSGWHGLGPIAVLPARQRQGIGSALVVEALARLRGLGSKGCVLLGDGGYYGRFGFRPPRGLHAPGLPAEHVFVLPFGEEPTGAVGYHAAFGL